MRTAWNRLDLSPEVVAKVSQDYLDGRTLEELAAELNVNINIVIRTVKANGGEIRKHTKKLDHPSFAQDVLNMAADGVRISEIAKLIGVTVKTVKSFLRSRGVEIPCLLNKPPATHWFCRDCQQTKLAFEFAEWRPGRPKSPCVKCANERQNKHAEENRESICASGRQTHRRRKKILIESYGGKCECCGESDVRFLSIDHANDDGQQCREKVGRGGAMYLDLVKREFPRDEGLRVLCYNCNFGRRPFTCCPHKFISGEPIPYKKPTETAAQKFRRTTELDIRKRVLSAYGNECACCGEANSLFLAVDHVHGDGRDDKKNGLPWCGPPLWRKLIADGFPTDRFQVLCFNCNFAKGVKDSCPHKHEVTT